MRRRGIESAGAIFSQGLVLLEKTVIAGLGAAGFSAVTTLRKSGYRGGIVVVDPKPFDLLHLCGIPYVLEGEADPAGIAQTLAPGSLGVEKIAGELASINTVTRSITVHAQSGTLSVSYDNLLLCTGSSPVIPPLRGISLAMNKGLYSLADASSAETVMEAVKGKKTGVVIGAGAIGLEAAAALKKHLQNVTVVEKEEEVLPGVLDPDIAKMVRAKLEQKGIVFRLGESADDVFFDGEFRGLSIGRDRVDFEMGICATGFSPNIDAASKAGVICGQFGIQTDHFMRTNVRGIYAAGDCAETVSVVDRRPMGAKLASAAWRQGAAAAFAIAGTPKEYPGSAGCFVTKLCGLEIAGTGFCSSEAFERGFDPVMAKITSKIKPDYMKDNSELTVKVIADRKSLRILGAQAAGDGAAARINLISSAMTFGIPLDRFCFSETAYCPSVSEVWDPLMRAAEGALRRTGG